MQPDEYYYPFVKEVILRYCQVSQEALQLLYSIAEIKQFKKDEVLIHAGSIARNVYILNKGAIIAYFIDREGNTYNKNIFLEGDFVGSTVSYLTGTPSNFELKAIEDCTTVSFNYKKYRQLINQHDELKDFYIAYLEKNWVIDKEKREIAIVMKEAKVRYLELLEQHPGIDKRIPLSYIASHLGVTPTQLSRIRKNLVK